MIPDVAPLIRLGLGALFLVAGIAKLVPNEKPDVLGATIYDRLRDSSPRTATTAAMLECGLGIWLLSAGAPAGALLATVVVLSAFCGTLAAELRRPAPLPCGCFSGFFESSAAPRQQLVRGIALNACLIFVASFAAFSSRSVRRDLTEAKLAKQLTASGARTRPAFTLIELLVSLGIMSVLIAIILPVVGVVRESARQTRCAANLRAIATGLGVYSTTWQGVLPRSGGYRPSLGPLWMVAALNGNNRRLNSSYAELADVDFLHCPSHPTSGTPSSFVMNAMAFDASPQWSRAAPACKWAKIRRQSSVPLLLETPDLFGGQGAWDFNAIFFEPALIVWSPRDFPQGPTESVSYVRHRRKQSNVLFADGHVAIVRPGDLSLNAFDDGIVGR